MATPARNGEMSVKQDKISFRCSFQMKTMSGQTIRKTYRGVSRCLNSHEVDELKEDWISLQRFYPRSAWSLRSNRL